MSQKGISFRLNFHITSIAIVIIALIVYINYHFSNKILVNKIEEGAINQSNLVISKVSRITVGTEEIAKNISAQALYYYENDNVDFLLNQVLISNDILESIHIEFFDKDNRTNKYSSNRHNQFTCDLDSFTAEKYLKRLDLNKTAKINGTWSDPFYCKKDTSHLLVSYQLPIYHPIKKQVAGIVSCQISLLEMKSLLSRIKIGENGYAFIVDQSGNLITNPIANKVFYENFFDELILFDDNNNVESKIRSGRSGAGHGISEYLGYQQSWFYYAPLSNPNWTIIIVIPENELFKEISAIFQKIMLVSGIGILVLFLLNMLIFKKMLAPLGRIAQAIQRFSTVKGKESNSKNEIRILAESLEDWQAKYGILIKEQSHTASEKLKFEKDLKSARDIQLNIIPSGKPTFAEHPEIDLSAILKPAETIGGDLYDYFFIDKNHLLIAIGDVSGKGISASLFMAIASTLIKSNAKILSSKDIVSRVNKELSDRNSNQYFVTLFIGILDVRSGSMDYCNAAHNFPYILHADGKIRTLSKSHGLPLGIYKNKTYRSSTHDLKYGDLLLLYTDGVINSRDLNDQHYGVEKLQTNIQNLNNLTAEEVVTKLSKSINIYEGENRQADDITLLALKYLNNKQETQT